MATLAPDRPPLEARHAGHLRTLNLQRVLTLALERPGPLTRQELGEGTGLSAPTISLLTAELLRRRLLREVGSAPSRGGRRATLVEFNARYGVVLGIVVGGADTVLAAADLRGALLTRRTLPTPARRGPRPVLARVAEAAHALLADPAAAGSPLLGVAAAVPGAVDRERGVVLALAPTLGGWARVPVGPVLAGALSAPVAVENDVNLAVLGERGRGAARGHDTCVFLWIGDGIGAGVVIGGALHRGHHSLAGEVGLMCPSPELLDRRFGARGALETLAAVRALRRRWPGRRPPTTAAWAAEFLAALRARDPRARRAFREAARLLGMAATNLTLALDPSLIVVGGPLAGPESPLPAEIARIVSRVIPTPPRIVGSALGPDAALWGGLLTAAAEARGRLRASLGAESA